MSTEVEYTDDLENGIFNLVVSLCQQKASTMPLARAKTEVAQYLIRLSNGLTQSEETEANNKGEAVARPKK